MKKAVWIGLFVSLTLVGCGGENSTPFGSSSTSNPRASSILNRSPIVPMLSTRQVKFTSGDTAIWNHPSDPKSNLVLGIDQNDEDGSLVAFDVSGKIVQSVKSLKGPAGIDLEYGVSFGGEKVDIVVLAESRENHLKVFALDSKTGKLSDVSGETQVFAGEEGAQSEPLGVALYKRQDGKVFALVSPKSGEKEKYLAQYELVEKAGKFDLKLVRRFGQFGGLDAVGDGAVESLFVDDELGYVYYSDELKGIRKYHANPDAQDAEKQLAFFGTGGFLGARKGISLYPTGKDSGYLIVSDQRAATSVLHFFPRVGKDGKHNHPELAQVLTSADQTDGIEISNQPFGARSDEGVLVMMNQAARTFHYYDWKQIDRILQPIKGNKNPRSASTSGVNKR